NVPFVLSAPCQNGALAPQSPHYFVNEFTSANFCAWWVHAKSEHPYWAVNVLSMYDTMLPASLFGFLLSQLCSCFEVMKAAVHISLLSWTDSSHLRRRKVAFPTVALSYTSGAKARPCPTGRNNDLQILRLSRGLIGDLGHSTNSRRRPRMPPAE